VTASHNGNGRPAEVREKIRQGQLRHWAEVRAARRQVWKVLAQLEFYVRSATGKDPLARHLIAELDSAMDRLGAETVDALPAVPEELRTTTTA
jgi:hypothetical protein